MTPDWGQVTLEQVRRACEIYDSGAATPRRPAQRTFLLLNGRSYPAKFIRGLAYRLATGVELDPQRDYSGGMETVRFFKNLGLLTRREPSVSSAEPSVSPAGTSTRLASAVPTAHSASAAAAGRISRLALVSHDYNVEDSRGLYDYTEHFSQVNHLCDQQGCDTVLYALYTWDDRSPLPRNHTDIFSGLLRIQRVILEVGQLFDRYDHVEVWQRDVDCPLVATQRFAKSAAAGYCKQAFLDDLPRRVVQDGLLVICGETNIASSVRGSDDFFDPYQFADFLRDMGVRLVLNPVHDYMSRHEMRKKRRYYSLGGRAVISVWNQGKKRESRQPWTVYYDGADRTDAVVEQPRPFSDRPDIRIGVLDLIALGTTPERS